MAILCMYAIDREECNSFKNDYYFFRLVFCDVCHYDAMHIDIG